MRLVPTLASILMLAACQPSSPAPDADVAGPMADAETPLMPADAPPQEETPAGASDPQASIPEGPDMAPTRVPGGEVSCAADIGAAASARLVERCINVSPATRPPCNVANPCALIQNEIDRSCAGFGDDKPAACAA